MCSYVFYFSGSKVTNVMKAKTEKRFSSLEMMHKAFNSLF